MQPDIDALIARLEAAGGPSRKLDGQIWCAIHGYTFVMWDGAGCLYRKTPDGSIHHQGACRVKEWMKTLDAALSLLPEGWPFRVGQHLTENGVEPFAEVNYEGETTGATPAAALLIAILKARKAAA